MVLSLFLFFLCLYIFARIWPYAFCKTISFLIAPFIRLYILFRISKKLEDPSRCQERWGIPSKKRPKNEVIWLHAVSVGEVISCIPFIEIVESLAPDVKILLTTTTLTSRDIIQQRLGDRVIHQFIPFDIFVWVHRFIKYWKPKAVFFVESELWPNTLFHLYAEDIPVYLLNTRVSARSLKRMFCLKKLLGILPYKLFREIFVPSAEVRNFVRDLGGTEITVVPNLKIISKKLPCTIDDAETTKMMINTRKTWIAVSTHPGEEETILSVHQKLKVKYNDLLTVIVPRHPNRSIEIAEMCQFNRCSFSMYTESLVARKPILEDIYIVDAMGVLGRFFENIDTVFVGGSLIPNIGGHNILEPIYFKCNVVTGLYTENFRDLYEYVKDFWHKVKDENELCNFVDHSLGSYAKKAQELKINQYKHLWEKITARILKDLLGE